MLIRNIRDFSQRIPAFSIALLLFLATAQATSSTQPYHGLSRFHPLKYPADFTHFDYVNPDAPKGGTARLFAHGTFDSLNPYATSGLTPSQAPAYNYMHYGFSEFNEPLMVGSGHYSPSGDEIKSAYGLIAASIEYPDNNQWAIFTLRPEARFHDQHPVTADDVVFSFQQLKTKGLPRYKMQLEAIDTVEKLGTHRVKFLFKAPGQRTQLFRAAELPVLPQHYWQNRALDQTTLTPPLNSGPYQMTNVQPGAAITFKRVKDYWGKDLPVNKGRYNFDTVTLYFHRDLQVAFESFKAGGHDIHLEIIAKNWAQAYDFPALRKGSIKRRLINHNMAYGSSFIFFNTRRPLFKDVRVRQALSLLYDFEWTNRVIFFDAYKRSASYFPNSMLAATGLPTSSEMATLSPWKSQLPETLFTQPYKNAVTQGNGDIRQQQQTALALLKAAGWEMNDKKLTHEKTGDVFAFEFLEKSSATARYLLPWKKNLETVGIDMVYRQIDVSQYFQRLRTHDFDVIEHILPQTLAPDQELAGYFHSDQVNTEGSRNLAGISHPAIDSLVDKIPYAKTEAELQALTRSLDRILLWQYYGVPKWYTDYMRVAYRDVFAWPEKSTGYTPPFSTWWYKGENPPR